MAALITYWCHRIIRFGFYALFLVTPLLLTPWNYELFEFNKMMATYALTTIIVGAWIIQSCINKRITFKKTPLDIPIFLFVTAQIISTLLSIDPHVSWFGYYSRFNGGLWSVFSYTLLYYAFVNNWTHEPSNTKHEKNNNAIHNKFSDLSLVSNRMSRLLKVTLIAGIAVSIYGVLERLGIDKHLWVQDVQNRVFSTLGQPNWLAAYLVALISIAQIFAIRGQNIKHNNHVVPFWSLRWVFWSCIASIFFLALLFTKSRSGFLGFIAAQIVFWMLLLLPYAKTIAAKKIDAIVHDARGIHTIQSFLAFFLVSLTIITIVGTPFDQINTWVTFDAWKTRIGQPKEKSSLAPPTTDNRQPTTAVAPLLETGGTQSSEIRKYVWQAALTAWQSTKKTLFVGTGTETFAFAFFQFKPPQHNMTSEWDFLYNKAHNEYLNYLATTGIFGLGSYLLFIGTFILWFVRQYISALAHQSKNTDPLTLDPLTLSFALFAGWTSILVTNFFGFSVVVTQIFLFLFPAFIIISLGKADTMHQYNIPPLLSRIFLALATSLVVLVLFVLGAMWWADTIFATGYRYNRTESFDRAYASFVTATNLNPNEPFYQDELANAAAGLAIAAIQQNESSRAATLASESIKRNDKAITVSPKNVNFWKTRTKIFYALSTIDASFNKAATQALEKALELSPADPKILYNLAILNGREAQNDLAIKRLRQAITLKPNYRDAYYALWVFHTEMHNTELAKKILEEYLTIVDPNDKDFLSRLQNQQ